jgi:hypothetical protein
VPGFELIGFEHGRNYFTPMFLKAIEVEDTRAVWLARARKIVEEKTARFERNECWNERGNGCGSGSNFAQVRLCPIIIVFDPINFSYRNRPLTESHPNSDYKGRAVLTKFLFSDSWRPVSVK